MNPDNTIPKSDPSVKSVNTLESLVPPVDLCSKIPDGIFADSALIWCYDGDFWHVEARATSFYNKEEDIRPAPTLQEILSCIDAIIDVSVHFHHRGEFRFVWAKKLSNGQLVTQDNPATAALKLWLELNKEGGEQ